MKILAIGSDKNLFKENSDVRARQKSYGFLVKEMHIIVFASKKLGLKKQNITQNVWIYPTNSRSKLLYVFNAIEIAWKIIGDDKNKWLITTQDAFESGLVGFVLRVVKKIPLHLQFHTDVFNNRWIKESMLNRIRYIIMRSIIPFADGFRVVSKRVERDLIKRNVSPEMITRIPVYSNTDMFNDGQKDYIPKNKKVLYVGRFTVEKNLPLLIRAFANVCKEVSEAKLVLVGDGPLRSSLVALCRELRIDEHVEFIPWTNNLVSYYKTASVFVLPSYYEGWGCVVIESLTAGTPVIMTDVGCAGEILRDGTEGFIVRHDDEQQLAEKIVLVLTDKELCDDMSKRGKERVVELLSKKETLDLYKKSWELAYENGVKRIKV